MDARDSAPAMAVWLTLGAALALRLGDCLASDPIPRGVHPGGMSSDNCSNHTAGTTVGNRFFWLPRNDTGRSGYIALAGDGHDGQKPGVPTMCLDASGGKEHLKGFTCGYPGCTGCQNQWFHFDTSDSSIRWDGGDGCLFQNDADGSPDHPEPFITMKMPCPAKVTDSAGQWAWGMNPPRTELDAAPIVNVKSNQCFSLSAGSGPPPGSTPSPGDAMVMVKCSGATRDGTLLAVGSSDPSPATSWVACTGEDCFAEGSYGATELTAIKNNASGLCLDAAGGFPGWGARVMPCVTSQLPWFWGNNPTTSATWRVMADGTLRTNISKAGSPINASGEACLFSSVPGNVSGNWWTSGQVGMWWCDGSPESKWKLTGGTLQAAAGVKSGMCLSSSPVNIPNPKPGPPPDPVHNPVTCKDGCRSAPCNGYPFCNIHLSPQARAEDFVSRLSLQEKATSLMWNSATVKRLGSPTIHYGEAQHGLIKGCISPSGGPCKDQSGDQSKCRCPTSFPSLVGLGASFNQSLFHAMGQVISDESRAYFNAVNGNTNLMYWAPSINLARNQLWGRNQETPGEDPLVNGLYGQIFIERLQGGVQAIDWDNASAPLLKSGASIKHYIAYDLECSSGGDTSQEAGVTRTPFDCDAPGVDRFHFEGFISDADLTDYYLAIFRRAIGNARPASIMCSFPSVNGVPSCANGLMQNTLARETWGFDGFIVSDCGGVDFLNQGHYLANTPQGAVAAALKGGMDAECGIPGPWGHGNYLATHMNETISQQLLNTSELDRSTVRVWRTAFRLGLFEPLASSPWAHLGYADIGSAVAQHTALDAAVQSMVLLKNDADLLPIDLNQHKTVAVIGPFQNVTNKMQGGYSGPSIIIRSHSPGTVLAQRINEAGKGTTLLWSPGLFNGRNDTTQIAAAVVAAKQADVALLFVGDTHVSEFRDRTDNGLEFAQDALLQAVCASGTPTVVILIAGHSIELSHAKSACDSILFALLPSEFGGDAIVDTLLGKYSPAGRLPVTFYDHSIMKTRDPVDMKLRTGSGITYQHYRGTPLWEFGFGLSYSTFSFSWAKMDAASVAAAVVASGETLLVYTVKVTNVGQRGAGVAVLGFVNGSTVAAANNDRHSGDAQQDLVSPPIRELFNFTRIWLDVNQSKTIELGMSPEILANTDANGVQAVRAGTYTVAIGGVGRAARVEDGAVIMPLTVYGEDAELFSMTKLRERHAKRTELA